MVFSSYCSYVSLTSTDCNTTVLHLCILSQFLGRHIKIEEAGKSVPPALTDGQGRNQEKELRDSHTMDNALSRSSLKYISSQSRNCWVYIYFPCAPISGLADDPLWAGHSFIWCNFKPPLGIVWFLSLCQVTLWQRVTKGLKCHL